MILVTFITWSVIPKSFPVDYCVNLACSIGWIKSSWTILNCNKTPKASHIATIFGQGIKLIFKICWCKFHVDDVNSDVTVVFSHMQAHIFNVQAGAAQLQCIVTLLERAMAIAMNMLRMKKHNLKALMEVS